jgi:hypothetical protein
VVESFGAFTEQVHVGSCGRLVRNLTLVVVKSSIHAFDAYDFSSVGAGGLSYFR